MSLPPSAQPQAPPPSRAKTWLIRVLTGLTTVMALVLAAAWVYSLFTLPGCDERRIRETLTSILRNNGVSTVSGLEAARETSRSDEAVACTRIVNVPNGRLDLTYRITKQGFGNNRVEAQWRPI